MRAAQKPFRCVQISLVHSLTRDFRGEGVSLDRPPKIFIGLTSVLRYSASRFERVGQRGNNNSWLRAEKKD